MEKILSISIAAYNAANTIKECLDSFLSSKYFNELEILIVNDGSTDDTEQMAMDYVERYPNTFVLINKKNGGHGSTINAALEKAKGKFFKIIDSDDWVDSAELDKLVTCLYKTEADLVVNAYAAVYPAVYPARIEIKKPFKSYKIGNVYSFEQLKKNKVNTSDLIPMHSTTIKTKNIKGLDYRITEKCFYADTEFIFYVAMVTDTIEFNDSCAYQYRLGVEGQSVSPSGVYKHVTDLMKIEYNLVKIYDDEIKKLNDSFRKRYLYTIIESRYEMLLLWYIKFIKITDKDIYWKEFSKKMKAEFPDYVSGFRVNLQYIIAKKIPSLLNFNRIIMNSPFVKLCKRIKNRK